MGSVAAANRLAEGVPDIATACSDPTWRRLTHARLNLASIGRRWDYSYGIYIYSYPVQLVLAVAGLQRFGLIPYTLVALTVAMAFAAASWHLVEKRVLTFKNARLACPDPTR